LERERDKRTTFRTGKRQHHVCVSVYRENGIWTCQRRERSSSQVQKLSFAGYQEEVPFERFPIEREKVKQNIRGKLL